MMRETGEKLLTALIFNLNYQLTLCTHEVNNIVQKREKEDEEINIKTRHLEIVFSV
jgi:hypothetical protein